MAVKQEKAPQTHHFGRVFGSPPGLPGGGMTGIVLPEGFGGGVCISGSMPAGGHSTPSDLASVSPSGLLASSWEGCTPSPFAEGCVGAHFVAERSAFGPAVCACGVAGAGAACASIRAGAAADAQTMTARRVDIRIRRERLRRADVPSRDQSLR